MVAFQLFLLVKLKILGQKSLFLQSVLNPMADMVIAITNVLPASFLVSLLNCPPVADHSDFLCQCLSFLCNSHFSFSEDCVCNVEY